MGECPPGEVGLGGLAPRHSALCILSSEAGVVLERATEAGRWPNCPGGACPSSVFCFWFT